jgi:hypothetical protein
MNETSDSVPPAIGPSIRLDIVLRSSGLWLGPIWAVVCGIVASGRFTWDARGLLLAGLTLFLVIVVWATLWTSAVETNWAAITAQWNATPPPLRPAALPYTRPGAPGDRAARWLFHLAHWWQSNLQPTASTAVLSIVVCLALGAALAAILGWQMLALSAAALATVQIGMVVNRATGQSVPAVKAVLEAGLAWLAGHAAYGSISMTSALMAGLFTFAYAGGLELVEQQNGLAGWRWPQLIAALLLLMTHHPLAALAVLFILFAQLLLEPALKQERDGIWFVRSSQVWLMATMLITAFTIR